MIRAWVRRWLGIEEQPRIEAKSLQDLVIEDIEEAEAKVDAKTNELKTRLVQLQDLLRLAEEKIEETEGLRDFLVRHNLDFRKIVEIEAPVVRGYPVLSEELVLGAEDFEKVAFRYRDFLFERTVPLEGHDVAYIVTGPVPSVGKSYRNERKLWANGGLMGGSENTIGPPKASLPEAVVREESHYVGNKAPFPWGEFSEQFRDAQTLEQASKDRVEILRPLVVNLARMGVLPRLKGQLSPSRKRVDTWKMLREMRPKKS